MELDRAGSKDAVLTPRKSLIGFGAVAIVLAAAELAIFFLVRGARIA